MASTSPKSPASSLRPALRRGQASENLVASPLKSSPSKSPKLSQSQSSKGRIASPKVKPVKKSPQSKGSLKAMAGNVMRKPASDIPPSLSDHQLYKRIVKEKAEKWQEAMCAIRSEWEVMKDYNQSFGYEPPMTWREFLDFFFVVLQA